MKRIGSLLLCLLFSCVLSLAAQKDFIIVIDPGHGGKDAGCIGRVLKEKDLNLAIALRVGQLISDNCPGVRVLYTRRTDVFITLMGRTEMANKANADLFLSIHADAIPKNSPVVEQTYGAGVFTMGTARTQENLDVAMRENRAILLEDNYETRYAGFDPSKPESYIIFEMMQNAHQAQSLEFAQAIQNSLVKRGKRHDRSVRQAGFFVLRTAAMPSVLVETGFISNAKEEKWLASADGKETIAKSIYMGFVDYKKSWDRKNAAHRAPQEGAATPHEATPAPPTKKPNGANEPERPNHSAPQGAAPTPQSPKPTPQGAPRTYKIQFLSSPKQLKQGAPELKGLWPVESYRDGSVYRYTYGQAATKGELQQKIIEVRKKFKDAFVVSFDERGNRVK